jgi:hypothetical protein
MSWTPVDDTQIPNWSQLTPVVTGGWGVVPVLNTPGWTVISAIVDGAFQFGAFQPAFQIGLGSAWYPVDDTQTGAWTPVPP